MLAVALAAASSVAWGFADFIGGLKSRKFAVAAVLVISQGAGLLLVGAVVAVRGEGAARRASSCSTPRCLRWRESAGLPRSIAGSRSVR